MICTPLERSLPVNGESKQWHEWPVIVKSNLKSILVFVRHSPGVYPRTAVVSQQECTSLLRQTGLVVGFQPHDLPAWVPLRGDQDENVSCAPNHSRRNEGRKAALDNACVAVATSPITDYHYGESQIYS